MSSHRSILLVDDAADALDAMATLLALDGWRTTCAGSIEGALQALERQRFAAVVMEPYLRSGPALAVALAARRLVDVPLLIALTWSARAGDHLAYEPTLFDFNLEKPADFDRLNRLLAMAW